MTRLPKPVFTVLAIALLVTWCDPAWAAGDRPTRGTVQTVNADQRQITIKDKDGKNWPFQVLDHAAIFEPNQANGKLSDLKAGDDVSLLWLKKASQFQASAILLHQGDYRDTGLSAGNIKNISADNNQLRVTDANGKEWMYQVTDNARFIRLDGKNSKLTDFRPNTHVAIAWDKKGGQYRVLAMCEDPAYASR